MTGNPFDSPKETLQRETTLSSASVTCGSQSSLKSYTATNLRNDTFNCNALPSCYLTCSGPKIELIHSVTHQCSCMTEWEIHSTLLQNLAAIVVYILLNISRFGSLDINS